MQSDPIHHAPVFKRKQALFLQFLSLPKPVDLSGFLSNIVPWAGILQGNVIAWLITCLNFMLLNSIVAISVGLLLQALDHAAQEERTGRTDLMLQQ